MAPPGLREPGTPLVTLGPQKVILDDETLPRPADLAAVIGDAHSHGSAVAVHCVTAEQLVVAVAAFEESAPGPSRRPAPDRIEHAAVVPPGYAAVLAERGLVVVTQPGFIADRGDSYRRHVSPAERDWLYPCATLLAAGAAVAAGTDAPFGPADPWRCVAAGASRRAPDGTVLGAQERVSPARSLRLFTAAAHDARQSRTVEAGQPGDVCILHAPLDDALRRPADCTVRATIIGGRLVDVSSAEP
jgi:predicted amidohydrolase YtcJ